jgi:peptidoglycan hydrolase CwlO-like protein
MEIAILALAVFALVALAAIFNTQKKILEELKTKKVNLDLNPVIEAIKGIHIPEPQKIEIPPAKEIKGVNIDLETLQEIATLMRVNQAEFQSGLDAFHKAIDKLLVQIPSGEKELDAQKEFMHKFEAAFARVQEQATEAMNGNSLRLQEILAEFLNKERSNG